MPISVIGISAPLMADRQVSPCQIRATKNTGSRNSEVSLKYCDKSKERVGEGTAASPLRSRYRDPGRGDDGGVIRRVWHTHPRS